LLWTVDPSDGEECLHILTAKGQLATIKGRDKIAPHRGGSAGTFKASKRDAPKSTAEAAKTKTQGAAAQTTKVAAKAAAVGNAESDDDSVLGKSNPRAPTATKSHPSSGAEPSVSNNDDDDDSLFGAPGDDEGTSSPLAKKNRFVDDEAAEDDDDDDDDKGAPKQSRGVTTPPRGQAPSARSPRVDDRDDFDNDDDDDDDIDEMPPPHRGHLPPRSAGIVLPEPQAPFAPSSTPLDLARRFLCWNHVGAVTRLISDDGRTVVNIDFTDSAFRRPISFTDNLGFVVGSLGEDGGIFCTDLSGDSDEYDVSPDVDALLDGLSEATRLAVKKSQQSRMRDGGKGKPTGSSIYFHRYEPSVGSTRDKDWHLTLPNGERALGCASGEGWAAVMTSRRFLRLFTSGGNQGRVHWLPGEPVTMAGRSRFLAVVYHQSSPLPDGTQQLGYMLIDAASDGRILCKGSLSCVSKGSALTWIGLSNDHCAMAMDSDGMLSMLASTGCADAEMDAKSSHWEWMPMLDTVGLRKSVDDNFWPITVYDGKLVCVPLKGGTRHPDAARRPVTTSLNFRLPLARGPLTQTYVSVCWRIQREKYSLFLTLSV
jgi:chromosome transmission fidelity protein 4